MKVAENQRVKLKGFGINEGLRTSLFSSFQELGGG